MYLTLIPIYEVIPFDKALELFSLHSLVYNDLHLMHCDVYVKVQLHCTPNIFVKNYANHNKRFNN